jgi:putative DNA primase/helicase
MLDTNADTDVAEAPPPTDASVVPLLTPPASKEETAYGALMRLPEVEEAQSALPGYYLLSSRGLQMMTEDKEGNPLTLWLCAPLVVCGKARTEDGGDWSTVLRFIDRDAVVRRELIADADLQAGSGKVLAKLAGRGLSVASDKASREGLIDLLRVWTPPARYRLVDCLGWTDGNYNAFVLGDGKVVGAARVLPRPHLGTFLMGTDQVEGTVTAWADQVGKLCVGNPLMMVSVSLALTAPLLQPLDMEGGGLHLRGASSTGKSTLLRLANSVWGTTSSLPTWNGTRNALESIAASHSGRLLALDEIGEADPRSVGETAYALANGQGKSRLTPSLSRTDLHWRLAVMSSGEESLAGHMARAGRASKAGQEVRLLDIPTDLIPIFVSLHGRSDSRTFAREVSNVLARNHGTVGPAFVKMLVGALPGNMEKFRAIMRAFQVQARREVDLPDDGVTERALQRFALIALAGELATKAAITGWQSGEATKAAIQALRLWVLGRDLPSCNEITASIRRVKDFVAAHRSRFVLLPAPATPSSKNHAGWLDDTFCYLTTDAWAEIHRGFDPSDVARQFQSRQLLITNESGLTFRMGRQIAGRPRCFAVRRAGIDSKPGIGAVP